MPYRSTYSAASPPLRARHGVGYRDAEFQTFNMPLKERTAHE
jgi:hypothetical protein